MCSAMGATMVQPCTAVCTAGEDPNFGGERPNSLQTRRPIPLPSPIEENVSQISINHRKMRDPGQYLEFENGGYCDENQLYTCPETFTTSCENSSELSTDMRRPNCPTVMRSGDHDTLFYQQTFHRAHESVNQINANKNMPYSHQGVYCNRSPSTKVCESSRPHEDSDFYDNTCASPCIRDAQHSYRSVSESCFIDKYPYDSDILNASYTNFKSLDSKGCDSPPRRLYQKPEGKVVIRPIAYRPAAPSPAQLAQGLSAPSGPIAGVGGRPPHDPRYTSTPALPRGAAPHYGSLGDLKSLGYSLDRRGLGTPLNHGLPPPGDHPSTYNPQGPLVGHPKHASLTHLHHVDHQPHSDIFIYHQNSSKINHANGNSSSIYSNTNTASLNHSCDSSNLNNTNTNCDSFVASPRSIDNSASEHNASPCESSPSVRNSSSLHKPPPPGHINTNDSPESPEACVIPNKLAHNHHNVYSSSSCSVGSNEPSSLLSTGSPLHRTNESNTQRFDGLKNCSPSVPPSHVDGVNNAHNNTSHHSMISSTNAAPSSHHQHHYHHLHHHHHRMGGSVSNLSRLSAAGGVGSSIVLDRSASVTGASISLTRAGGSINGSMTELDDPSHQTPSPSDSGVAELEAILKEKDSEICLLKESMEQSEQIIFKVYEEKEKTWERELKKIRDIYEARLKASQQKIASLEQSLASQTYQMQQERRKVSVEAAEARRDRDAVRQQQQLQHTVASLRSQLEETEWGLCQKSGEISLLKSQLKDCQGDQTSRGHELLHLRAQLRQYALEVERRRTEVASLHELSATLRKEAAELRAQQQPASSGSGDSDADQLRKATQELALLREERVRERERITEERSRWQQEKESVLRYQRQLQLACQHAQRTNRRLQQEVTRLQADGQAAAEPTSPPAVPPLPPGYNLPPSPVPPPPGVLSEEALC